MVCIDVLCVDPWDTKACIDSLPDCIKSGHAAYVLHSLETCKKPSLHRPYKLSRWDWRVDDARRYGKSQMRQSEEEPLSEEVNTHKSRLIWDSLAVVTGGSELSCSVGTDARWVVV
jgi:hypothetical protein